MLHAVTQLSENVFRYIGRTLGYEINAHSLASDETNHLLYLVNKCFRGILEQHVRLVEEEYKFRKLHITHLRQRAVEFRKQPEQEC